ncbi:hypothetical protein [Georgenia thermotolerans]|uniref:Uncharacterized protein n=1 Tax=Georgenia thermotolerans TaxID=527326 RepID=A0A7J5UNK8_9MICO|nr:hypothetical protein [Georgenia thermotolerans]KAE8763684.1 hypothetical protein GB883_12755 [Georgenia thermotolerans]
MTTPETSPDHPGSADPVTAPGRRARPHDVDDLESTAVRRQRLLGRLDEPPAGQDEPAAQPTAEPAAPAHQHPEPPTSAFPAPREDTVPGLRPRWQEAPDPADVALAGASEARPRSRAAAHVWALVVTLLLAPVAWYLVADAGARLTLGEDSPWATGTLAPAAVVELVCGLLVLAVVLLAARWSSLGALVVGALVLLAGAAFVLLPGPTADALAPVLDQVRSQGDLGGNVAHHLLADGPSGRLAQAGLTLVLVGVVSHGARRLGRAEERGRREAARRDLGQGGARHGVR